MQDSLASLFDRSVKRSRTGARYSMAWTDREQGETVLRSNRMNSERTKRKCADDRGLSPTDTPPPPKSRIRIMIRLRHIFWQKGIFNFFHVWYIKNICFACTICYIRQSDSLPEDFTEAWKNLKTVLKFKHLFFFIYPKKQGLNFLEVNENDRFSPFKAPVCLCSNLY